MPTTSNSHQITPDDHHGHHHLVRRQPNTPAQLISQLAGIALWALLLAGQPALAAAQNDAIQDWINQWYDPQQYAIRIKEAEEAEIARLAGKMVAIPAGSFPMGDLNDGGRDNEKPVHRVNIDSFWMGAHEVTVGQFRAFVKDSGHNMDNECWTYENGEWQNRAGLSWRSPGFDQNEAHPVVCVSHHDAQAFITWLNKKTGQHYRLPTEAEWEYAARAGTTTQYSWGNSESQVNNYAWYYKNSGGRTHAVGSKRANPWGLYGMYGNVWEWVQDWYDKDYYSNSPVNNPQGPSSGRYRVHRGGSWNNARNLRSANRYYDSPGFRIHFLGFRLVRQP